MYQNFIIPHLYEAQHVSGNTAHHQEPETALAASGFAYVEVVGRVVGGRQAQYVPGNVHYSTFI
jgi:hypothetical protein